MDNETLFILCIFGIITGVVWWASRKLAGPENGKIRERLRDKDAPIEAKKAGAGISGMLNTLGQAAAKPFEPKTREKQSDLRKKLARAGIYTAGASKLVTGAKVIALFIGVILGYVIGDAIGNLLLGLSCFGLMAYMIPSLWLSGRIRKHQQALNLGLPDALDLLVVCVEAGLTVDSAMQRVGAEMILSSPAIARELDIAHMETRMGLPRAEALRNIGTRTGNDALKGLASMLVQAERFGTSIASALRVHAEGMRITRQHQAEEMAAKATVKLSFPVVLFIFPAVLIVLAGPAMLGLFKSALFN